MSRLFQVVVLCPSSFIMQRIPFLPRSALPLLLTETDLPNWSTDSCRLRMWFSEHCLHSIMSSGYRLWLLHWPEMKLLGTSFPLRVPIASRVWSVRIVLRGRRSRRSRSQAASAQYRGESRDQAQI